MYVGDITRYPSESSELVTLGGRVADRVVAVQICVKAFAPNQGGKLASGHTHRTLFRRSSDPHRKKREVVYSKGLVRSVLSRSRCGTCD